MKLPEGIGNKFRWLRHQEDGIEALVRDCAKVGYDIPQLTHEDAALYEERCLARYGLTESPTEGEKK